MDSKKSFNAIKSNQIKLFEVKNKQDNFFKKLNEVKIDKKNTGQKGVINNLKTFYNSREEIINVFRDYIEMLSDANYDAKQNKTEETRLKVVTPKQMLQRLSIALSKVKAGNNSESLLNKIGKIICSLYQSKQMTKKCIK